MRHYWTQAEIAILVKKYPNTRTADLVEELQHPEKSIYSKARELGIKKSDEYLDSPAACRLRRGDDIGRDTRFQPGHSTWNKGKKGWQAGGRSVDTQFKKGHRGGRAEALHQPVGAERITRDGYIERKINDDLPFYKRWKALHNIVWEGHHGEIPRGHVVVFRNGNRQDVSIENLQLISRAELMRRNTIHRYPPELKQTIRLAGKLNRKIHEKQN